MTIVPIHNPRVFLRTFNGSFAAKKKSIETTNIAAAEIGSAVANA
jgi:hypothetical protein